MFLLSHIPADAAAPPDVLFDSDVFGNVLIISLCAAVLLSLAAVVAIIVIVNINKKK